jgi:hypothetical protein
LGIEFCDVNNLLFMTMLWETKMRGAWKRPLFENGRQIGEWGNFRSWFESRIWGEFDGFEKLE